MKHTGNQRKKVPPLTENSNKTIKYHYSPSAQLNLSIFNLNLYALNLKIVHHTLEIQASKVEIYSALEIRGFGNGPSHNLYQAHFPKHLYSQDLHGW